MMTTRTDTRDSVGSAQVHLDFHTAGEFDEVGKGFDADRFAGRLRDSGVDHVNLFAKCHHGWSYYPTDLGHPHPGLVFDLLGAQIDACREAGLIIGVYYTVGWSAADLDKHPEWVATHRDGTPQTLNVDLKAAPGDRRPFNSWVYLCPSGRYLDLMIAQVDEIAHRYAPDGFFFDICNGVTCFCDRCRAGMKAEGIDPSDPEGGRRFNRSRLGHALKALRRAARIEEGARWGFFNGTTVLHDTAIHVGAVTSGLAHLNTHQAIEDLPTTWGGYDKLPLRARYFHGLDFDLVAMSARFHTSWGEFGGYKSRRAIEYEARLMIANGARCNFGDQLHPNGRLDDQTYDLLGTVYRNVEGLSEYIDGARPDSNLALCLSTDEEDDQGVARALLEAHREFVVAPAAQLDPVRHEAVVVAGPLPTGAEDHLVRYGAGGGRILALGDALRDWPASMTGRKFGIGNARRPTADGDYISFVGGELGALGSGLVYNYEPGRRYELAPGAEVLGLIHEAYFDRTYERYYSHRNAPPQEQAGGYPAVHRYGSHLVAAHPLGRLYLRHGAEAHRSLLWALLSMINPNPTIEVSGLPPGGRVTVMHQPGRRRTVVHALYAPPASRGEAVIVDDVVPVTGVTARLRLRREVVAASTGHSGDPIAVVHDDDGAIRIELPVIVMHAAVVLHHP
ncbi:MAG: alpha-L-fucosidase [bacterium]|nr:alpha-L-fucosidase [bacterium]